MAEMWLNKWENFITWIELKIKIAPKFLHPFTLSLNSLLIT